MYDLKINQNVIQKKKNYKTLNSCFEKIIIIIYTYGFSVTSHLVCSRRRTRLLPDGILWNVISFSKHHAVSFDRTHNRGQVVVDIPSTYPCVPAVRQIPVVFLSVTTLSIIHAITHEDGHEGRVGAPATIPPTRFPPASHLPELGWVSPCSRSVRFSCLARI